MNIYLHSCCMVYIIGIFYYLLGNLSPYLRSSLQSIQVVSIVKSQVLNTYGVDTILEPFMEGIQKLEEVSTCMNCGYRQLNV